MVARFEQGFDVVSASGSAATARACSSGERRRCSMKLMRKAVDERLMPQVGDFRLFSRTPRGVIRGFREQHRFNLPRTGRLAGPQGSRNPIPTPRTDCRLNEIPCVENGPLCLDGRIVLLTLPLKFALIVGLLLTGTGAFVLLRVLYETLVLQTTVRGWSSLACLQLIFSGRSYPPWDW